MHLRLHCKFSNSKFRRIHACCGERQAHVRNRMGKPYAASYDFDKLGAKPPLNLPSAAKTFSSGLTLERMRAAQKDDSHVPDSVKDRVASVLASEFSKKVTQPISWARNKLRPCPRNRMDSGGRVWCICRQFAIQTALGVVCCRIRH